MTMRQILPVALGVAMVSALLTANVTAQDAGTIAGTSKTHGANYEVRLQDVTTRQVVSRVSLDQGDAFSFPGLALPGNFLVVLYDTANARVVCTEGPYELTPGSQATAQKLDVRISCGKPPALLWFGGLAGATAAVLAVTLQSGSN